MTPSLPLAFYGTLRPGGGALGILGIAPRLQWLGRCFLRGDLYDLGEYPGLMPGNGIVTCDLVTAPDPATMRMIDTWEDWIPGNPPEALYRRQRVRLLFPDRDALVYVWNGSLDEATLVPGGDWLSR